MVLDQVVLEGLVKDGFDEVVSKFRDGISRSSGVCLFGKVLRELGWRVRLSHSSQLLAAKWFSVQP
jgi:hypothetical protein